VRGSLDSFQQAIAIDPGYAPAHGGLAYSLCMMAFYGFIRGEEAMPKAAAAGRKAIALDASNADAHVALSMHALQAERDLPLGVHLAQEAVRLKPDLGIAQHALSVALNVARRSEEALVAVRKAVELDPLTPIFQAHVGWTLHCLGRDDEAWHHLKSALQFHPNDYYILRILMYCADTPERIREAIEAGQKVATLTKSRAVSHGMLGFAYARMGERERALEITRRLEEEAAREPALGYYVGLIRGTLGETETAVEWLEKAEQARLGLLIILAVEPSFAPLRGSPRFQALLRKLGLPATWR
jgi:adenylate cyclase